MTIRERIARTLLTIAAKIDPENRLAYKFERGWQQPVRPDAGVRFIIQGSDINGDTGL